jgi:hypothetical protein
LDRNLIAVPEGEVLLLHDHEDIAIFHLDRDFETGFCRYHFFDFLTHDHTGGGSHAACDRSRHTATPGGDSHAATHGSSGDCSSA